MYIQGGGGESEELERAGKLILSSKMIALKACSEGLTL